MLDLHNPQFDPRDTAIIGIQTAAYDPEADDDFLQGLIEDYEDITLADTRLFREFLENSEYSGLWESIVELCHFLASTDAEELGGQCKLAYKVRAHLMAAVKLYAKEKAKKEIEKDSVPDIYGTDFYSHS